MTKLSFPKLSFPKLNFGTILLVIAALVNVPRWVGLFTMSDSMPQWVVDVNLILEYIGGVLMGLTIAGGLAFVTHRLGALQPFTEKGKPIIRFWGALITDMAIMIASAVLLPPYVRVLMPVVLRSEIGQGIDVWSIVAVLVGDLIIVAIALVDAKAAGFTRSPKPKLTKRTAGSGSAKQSGSLKSAQRNKKPLSGKKGSLKVGFPCPYVENGCDTVKATQNAINAHSGKCKYNPALHFFEKAGNDVKVTAE
jgi:hypothetical protein